MAGAAAEARQLLTDAVVQPFVEQWLVYRRMQMMPKVYDAAVLHQAYPSPLAEADALADDAAAAEECAVPFVPGRYGAADHSMEEAVKLSRDREVGRYVGR